MSQELIDPSVVEDVRPTSGESTSDEDVSETDHVVYENPIKPLLWILVPFALTLLYGIFMPT